MGGEALSSTLNNITLTFVISVVSFIVEIYPDVSVLVQAQKWEVCHWMFQCIMLVGDSFGQCNAECIEQGRGHFGGKNGWRRGWRLTRRLFFYRNAQCQEALVDVNYYQETTIEWRELVQNESHGWRICNFRLRVKIHIIVDYDLIVPNNPHAK